MICALQFFPLSVLVVSNTQQLVKDVINWLSIPGEVQGAYQIKVTTSALALLLLTKHGELGNVHVQGNLIKVEFYFFSTKWLSLFI